MLQVPPTEADFRAILKRHMTLVKSSARSMARTSFDDYVFVFEVYSEPPSDGGELIWEGECCASVRGMFGGSIQEYPWTDIESTESMPGYAEPTPPELRFEGDEQPPQSWFIKIVVALRADPSKVALLFEGRAAGKMNAEDYGGYDTITFESFSPFLENSISPADHTNADLPWYERRDEAFRDTIVCVFFHVQSRILEMDLTAMGQLGGQRLTRPNEILLKIERFLTFE